MTDATSAQLGEEELLDAVDEQLIQQLADRVRAQGSAVDRGGRPAGPADQDGGRVRPGG